jgi:L-threonylcarbamoyladenylate synthase
MADSQSGHTERLAPTGAGIARAADLLRAGRLVAFPTETVYGLGGLARDPKAVAAIYAAKGRPSFNPLIVHVADMDAARRIARFDPQAEQLARAFWPGPLTLVLPLAQGHGLAAGVTAGLETVALRLPAGATASALLRAIGAPIAAPSANPSGQISPTSAAHVLAGLDGRIAAVLDDGPCPVGLESTILATQPMPRLLRAGGVAVERIEAKLGQPVDCTTVTDDSAPTAPGQLGSHYAPRKPVRLGVTQPGPGALWLGFGPQCHGASLNLSETGDLAQAAANLFDALHRLDAMPGERIEIAPIPETGLGAAINDRLRRAAAPRT